MMHCEQTAPSADSHREPRRLLGRYFRQLREGRALPTAAVAETWALTFSPGNHTCTFYGKTLRPLGSSIALLMTNEEDGVPPWIAGFRARLSSDGSVTYGVQGDREFRRRYAVRVRPGAGLDPFGNPSLFDAAVRLNAGCLLGAGKRERLPTIPRLPRIWLGFAPDQLPEFVDTPALRRLAAGSIGISTRHLAHNPAELVERLLRHTWEAQLRLPGTAGNPTELALIDAELCTGAQRALKAWEDFSDLVNVGTWNPVRAVTIFSRANPAAEVLLAHGLDPQSPVEHQVTSGELLEVLEQALREKLGEQAVRFSAEDLYEGLLAPHAELQAVSESLPALRRQLTPYWSACATDQDLRDAALNPAGPLLASGACRVQVLRRQDTPEPFLFRPEALGRRITADWECDYRHQPTLFAGAAA